MRIAAGLLAVVSAVSIAIGQEVIEWSSSRKLQRSDFAGRVPTSAAKTSLSWIRIDASWECREGVLHATVRAVFDPSRSWWRSEPDAGWRRGRRAADAEARLLEHEQGHFDLTEIAARRIRTRLDAFTDACVSPGGTEPIQAAVAEIDRALHDEQERYDRETDHGTNASAQARWTRRIHQDLAAR